MFQIVAGGRKVKFETLAEARVLADEIAAKTGIIVGIERVGE